MKVLILSYGTRGDVQPFVALAKTLADRGHEVCIGLQEGLLHLATNLNIEVVPLDDIVQQWLSIEQNKKGFESNFAGLRGKIAYRSFRTTFKRMAKRLLEDMSILSMENADVVVHHFLVPGHEIAEKLGAPAVPVSLAPYLVPTRSTPYPIFPFNVPSFLNRATYLQAYSLRIGQNFSTAKWQRDFLGLARRASRWNCAITPEREPATVLQPFTKHFWELPLQYPDYVHTTGFWLLSSAHETNENTILKDFIQAGEPPVYIGFGSMVGSDAGGTSRTLLEAVRRAQVRAIINCGWGGIERDVDNHDVLYIDEAPIDWLFPQMSAIIHHGGIGTIGAALASGRPQVACPHVFDQHFFSDLLHASQVAPAPIRQDNLTSDTLAEAIHLARTDKTYTDRARELASNIQSENGALAAAKVLEGIVG